VIKNGALSDVLFGCPDSESFGMQGACVEEDKMLLITEYMDGALFKSVCQS